MRCVIGMILISVLLALTGCPLQTTEPIDGGSYNAGKWLSGNWLCTAGNNKGTVYKIRNHAPNLAIINVSYRDTMLNEEVTKRVVLSSVSDKIFASVYDAGDELTSEGYFIYRLYKISDRHMKLTPVSEHVQPGNSGAEIKSFLEKNADTDIYDEADALEFEKR